MLDVRNGDTGPRVFLLQMLLNRSGAKLQVDGVFGPQTGRAVAEARRRIFEGKGPLTNGTASRVSLPLANRGGAADPDLWMALFEEQRLCCVDAFDMGEERFQIGAALVKIAGSRTVETGATCNGVGAVVQGIAAQTGPAGSLGLLRTWGHGNRGHWLTFTVGEVVHLRENDPVQGAAVDAERRSYVDPDNFQEMSPVLLPVGRCFANVGIYEHHGCSLGKIAATRRMMERLANLWGVPVTVGMGVQKIPYHYKTALRFQGQTFTAYPGGSSGAWIARVLEAERPACGAMASTFRQTSQVRY